MEIIEVGERSGTQVANSIGLYICASSDPSTITSSWSKDNGARPVADYEYDYDDDDYDDDDHRQNLSTSAVGFKQEKTVSNAKLADQVLDRYESAIFTCGKFTFGQVVYDKVLKQLTPPITFEDYLLLPTSKQIPIDDQSNKQSIKTQFHQRYISSALTLS